MSAENVLHSFPQLPQIIRMSAPASNSTSVTAPQNTPAQAEIIPHSTTLLHASRLGIKDDKPIQLDYYVDSATGKAFIGEDPETKEKMLVKSDQEFTSLISKIYRVAEPNTNKEDFIIITENSIYLVNGKIQKRRINATQMRSVDYEQL